MKARASWLVLLGLIGVGLIILVWQHSQPPAPLAPVHQDDGQPNHAGGAPEGNQAQAQPAIDPQTALDRGIAYLIHVQGSDGGWHSTTYGQLKPGAATTALVLYALSHAPGKPSPEAARAIARGVEFLQPGIQKSGYVANPDGSPDYPTYATAMLLTAYDRLHWNAPPGQVKQLAQYLLDSQLHEAQGWQPDETQYGGWDFIGHASESHHETTGTNLSVTRFVLEALACPSVASLDLNGAHAVQTRAVKWLGRCQNLPGDGGFYFLPVVTDSGNKAGWSDDAHQRPRSYGSMTCDGLQALAYCQLDTSDARRRAAGQWLLAQPGIVHETPGFEQSPAEAGWREGLHFYYFASLSKALRLIASDKAPDLALQLAANVASQQQRDGSWESASSRMREDDPLIASSLAIIALAQSLVGP